MILKILDIFNGGDKTSRRERALARAERKLAHIQSLIDRGHLGWLTYLRLNRVCRKIEKLDPTLGGGSFR
jgi:hypothetical protein